MIGHLDDFEKIRAWMEEHLRPFHDVPVENVVLRMKWFDDLTSELRKHYHAESGAKDAVRTSGFYGTLYMDILTVKDCETTNFAMALPTMLDHLNIHMLNYQIHHGGGREYCLWYAADLISTIPPRKEIVEQTVRYSMVGYMLADDFPALSDSTRRV